MIDWHGTRIWQIATLAVSVVVVTVLASGAIYLAATNSGLNSELVAAHSDTRAATTNADSLYQQLLTEGIKPAAEKPAEVVAGNTGQAGDQGPRGFTGETGAKGADGISGIAGLPGAAGMTGIDGSSGTNGADSTTPGPTGATGADSQVPGPTGPTGEPPASWTYADPAGVKYDCTRTTPFDPAAPTYSCSPEGVTP